MKNNFSLMLSLLFTITTTHAQYISSTLEQVSATTIAPGSVNQQIVRIRINTGPAAMGIYALFFSTDGTTNPSADLSSAKVFYTDSSNVFTTTTQYGSTVYAPITSGAPFNYTMPIVSGTNYFWLVYDITSSATACDSLDAACYTAYLTDGTHTPDVTHPPGYALIAPCITGINDDFQKNSSSISVFPNPSSQSTTLKFENPFHLTYTLKLYNSKGRLTKVIDNIITGEVLIERKYLSEGLYLFQLSNDKNQITVGKLMIE